MESSGYFAAQISVMLKNLWEQDGSIVFDKYSHLGATKMDIFVKKIS